jgi:soluble epoxide hydrolase/lipid-phosphate phosphatase
MNSLTKKTLKNSRSLTYTYYVSPAKSPLPTVLLIHGCPDSASLWADLITTHLQPGGYGAVAVDNLGYAGSSKPTDSASYAVNLMTNDLCEILDAENLDQIIPLGHDWGSILAARLYNFHPERVKGLVTLNVAYVPPRGQPFHLDEMNAMMTQRIGYGSFWYWYLFTSEEGPKILDAHVESFFTALHGDPATWMDIFCKKDGLKNYLLENRKQDVLQYATSEMREAFVKRMTEDGFTAPLLWYKAMVENRDLEAEKVLHETSVVKVPLLFIAATKDLLGPPAAIQGPAQMGLLPDLTINEIDAGHWSMLAKPQEVGESLTKWLKSKF